MYIRGLIPWNFAELAEAVPIALDTVFNKIRYKQLTSRHTTLIYQHVESKTRL